MRSLLAVLLLAYPLFANAETWVSVSVASYHVERRDYCEVNAGLGIEHGDKLRLVAGTYQNSLCRTANYIGVNYSPWRYGNFRFGSAVLAVTGYQVDRARSGTREVFALIPTIGYERKNYGANLVLIPPYDDFRGAIGIQAKFKF